ncbi:MAG: 2,3,4,5-tetrahydropyridine-2,6-dicarboxylate N-succinyltransferase [Bacteroidetes bacterium]|nr:2,3,4,5-tetrahydropyridine-2,6-dicarboxylate N-succinyltransferase [Rhodothermia bacterium]MCS7154791.1 2,3,4,5-tetrahydropyridine-2,6-dicarboxylate N-succinyltransferase [Bacteroidota bacterium]MCX7907052.1 2,3,4,5-tetrahydropyridine-2,6-dicarboxylate N-succinyltransferase [Bacteroidota bacterium]MDW8137584.1 2,3,4,5-tetrahydropyridine-2,6-dicarboxylate N-succinyltransferase [Bacteroidota bacterium]MDW8285462.1 2,3,4,5-tetrahydropyridine-2,6-dicarboxylate N-succinyltransferase [Bacteroidota
MSSLAERIERYAHGPLEGKERSEALRCVQELFEALRTGRIRAAEPDPQAPAGWRVHAWVKAGILLGFRLGELIEVQAGPTWRFFDKATLPVRPTTLRERVRIVPGGTTVRDGAYLAPGVILMPPSYVNVGAYVDEGAMIDSHVLVGSCAQIGRRVHLSAGVQIGGVIEPVGALPVIIEDEAFVGAHAAILEGAIVRRRAVIAPSVVLTASTPLYDLVRDRIWRAENGQPLIVPEGAVVVPGVRAAHNRGTLAQEEGIGLYVPVIVKYRDASTEARLALEDAVR